MRNRVLLFLLLLQSLAFAQTTYYSRSSGNWNDPSIWSTVACGNSTNAGTFPQSGDVAIICNNIQINTNVTCSDILVNPSGILEFSNTGSFTVTLTQGLTIVSGGVFRYQSNASRIHAISIGGNFSNEGTVDFFYDTDDYVGITFSGLTNTVVSGIGGNWDLYHITINKGTKTTIVEVNTANFYSNFNGGNWTHTQGTYYLNCNATHILGNGVNYTINEKSIVRVDNNGTIHFGENASRLILQGRVELMNGTITIGSTAGAAPNGIVYQSIGGVIPELIQHNGTINIYQGIQPNSGTDPLAFSSYGGTLNLNLGSTVASNETFKINNHGNSMFYISGGNIHYFKPNSASLSDLNVCGTSGSVTSLSGTVKFGIAGTPNNSVFRFTPYASVILPNFRVSGNFTDSIIAKPSIAGDFKLLSLYLESGKTFDMSHNSNSGDNRTMTLTGTYDGTTCYQDDNLNYTDYFKYRNSTVVVEGNSTIKVSSSNTYKPRFFNLRCAYPGFTTRIKETTGVENILYAMGGIIQATDGWQQIYLEGNNPLAITGGSDFLVESIRFNKWNAAQNIPAYTYNTKLVICGHNNSTYMQGNVTCNYLYVNGDTQTSRNCTFYPNNYILIVLNDLIVGASGGVTNAKQFIAGTSNITINGNLILEQDAEFNAQSSGIYIYGNWLDYGAATINKGFNEGSSTVIFSGGNSQLTCTNGPEDFYHVRMDKNAGNLTLLSPATASFRITFVQGKMITNSTNHFTLKYGATNTGGSSLSFIEGPMRYIGLGTMAFPIGKGTRYRPCTLYSVNNNAASDVHRAEYFDYSPDPPYNVNSKDGVISSVSTCEYWSVQKESGSSFGHIRLAYDVGSCNTASYASFAVTRWDGTAWRDLGGMGRAGNAVAGSEESSINTSFDGPYTHCVEGGPSITAGGPTTFCVGNTLTLTSSSGPNYLWSTGATTQAIVVNSSGSYTVTVNGLTSAPIVVTAVSQPAAPSTSGIKVCTSTSGTLTASGGSGYNWYDASTGGTLLGSGANYTTPNLATTTTYYVASVNGSCESLTRTAATATVVTKPALTTNVSTAYSCGNQELIAYTSGVSNAIRMDGIDDYIAMPTIVFFNGNYTVEGWVNLKVLGGNQRFIEFGNGTDNVSIELSNGTNNRMRFITYKGAAQRIVSVPADRLPLTLNQWVHVACRIKDSTGTIFINGDSITSGLSYPGQNTVSNPAYIGRSNSGSVYTQADFDEFRIWNIARTSAQIKSGMLVSYPNGTPNIISYLRMDEGTGTITDDVVIGPNPALFGSPTWIFNGAPIDITYAWTPPAGLSSTTTKSVIAAPSVNTTYTITTTYLPGCTNSANVSVNITPPGDTSVSGNNIWNVYGFNSKTFTNYTGYYTSNPLNMDSQLDWNQSLSPSYASTYQGCTLPTDSISVRARRTNFTANTYELIITTNDDYCWVYLNDTLKFTDVLKTGVPRSAWIGNLNASSKMDIRWNDYTANCKILFTLSPIAKPSLNPGSIGSDQTLCLVNDPALLTSVSPATGCFISGYQWQDSISGGNWTNIVGATALTYDPGVISQTKYFRRKVKDDCYQTAYSNIVTVTFQNPQAPTISGTTNVCENTAAVITANGTEPTFLWYNVPTGGSSIYTGATYTTPPVTGVISYYASSKIGSCESASRTTVTLTITVAPSTSSAGSDQNVCATTATLAANTPTNGTGSWSVVSGTASITTPSSPTSGVTGLVVGSATLRWTISNAPCAASTDDVIITRTATPTTSAAGSDQNVCASTATLAGNTPTTGTGSWSVVSGTATVTTPSSPTSGVTGLVVGSVTLRWTISNAPCVASTDDVIITQVATPTVAAAGSDQSVCGSTTSLAANFPTAGTGNWTVISGTATITTPNSQTSGVSGLVVGSATLRWTISNAPCTSTSDDVIITRMAPPTISAAGSDQSVCATTATLAGNIPVDGTGSWSVISGTATITTPSSPTSGVTGLIVGSATLRWTISNAPCVASTDDVIITRVPFPSIAAAGSDQNVCATTTTLAANNPLAGTGSWSVVSGTATVTTPSSPTSGVTGLVVGSATLRWTISNAPCVASTDDVIITQIATPTVSAAGSDQNVCATTATLAANTPTNGTGSWSVVSGTASVTTPSSPTSGVTGLVVGSATLRWTISNSPCVASTDDVIITQIATPTVSTAGSDQNICATTATLAANTPTNGTGSWTVVSGTATVTTPSSPTSGVTGLVVGSATLRWTISNAPCVASTDDVIITQIATPTVSAAGNDQNVCASTATLAANTPTAGTGSWSVVSGTANVTTPSSPTSGVTGLVVGSATLRWTISNSPCAASTDDIIVTRVSDITVANAGSDQNTCADTTTLAANSPVVGTGTWTLISGTANIITPTSPTSEITGLAPGSSTLRWTISGAPCTASTDDVVLTRAGTAPDVSFDKPYYCSTDRIQAKVNGQSGSLTLDGTDDHVALPAATYFNGDFTIEGWIYMDQFSKWTRFFDFGNGEKSDNVLISLDGNFSQRIEVHVYNGNLMTKLVSTQGLNPYLNNWFHIAYSQQGTTGVLYLNGEISNSGTMYAPLNVVRTSNYFGKSNWLTDQYMKGKMDEIRIWNTARTQAEILSTMMVEIPSNTPGLQNYWNFNESSGNALDITSANNGTLMNGILRNTAGAPLGYTYNWTPNTNLSTNNEFYTRANPASATNYQVVVANGSCKDSATVLVNPAPAVDTSVYGTTQWNVYVFEGFNFDALHGSFQQAALNYDSRNSYLQGNAPSSASGYVGCDVSSTYHSQLIRRTNFTEGIYRLDIGGHDDNLRIRLNYDTIFNHSSCCDIHNGAWIGKLKPSSLLDMQLKNRLGQSYLFISLNPDLPPPLNAGVISTNQTLCGFQIPDTLRNVSLASGCSNIKYQWQDSTIASGGWNDIALATDTFYVSPGLSVTTWFRRVATDACEQVSYSNVIEITIDSPLPPTAPGKNLCAPSSVTLTASGGLSYRWYDSPGGGTLLASTASYTTPVISVPTTFYVAALSGIGCEGTRTAVLVDMLGSAPGDTSLFGNNEWLAFAFDGSDFNTYRGYYSESALNLNSTLLYDQNNSPSFVSNYQGCVVQNEFHSTRFKRTGFASGVYRINILNHDDVVGLWIDGIQVFVDSGYARPHYAIWQGNLNNSSKIEFRLTENTSVTYVSWQFENVINPIPPVFIGTINKDTVFCDSGDPVPFNSSLSLLPSKDAFVFEGSPTTNFGADTYIRTKKTGGALKRHAFATFDLNQVTTPISSAILQLYVESAGGNEQHQLLGVYAVTDTTWSEMGMNYTNYPAWSARLDTVRVYDGFTVKELNVTNYMESQRLAGMRYVTLAFVMENIGLNVIHIGSKENTSNPLKLLINKSISACQYNVQWQYNLGCNTTWYDITGATSDEFDHGIITEKTCYRKYLYDACGRSDTSNVITADLDSLSIAGTIGGTPTICANSGSSLLTLTGERANTISWEYSTDNITFVTTGATGASTNVTNVPDTTWYRAIAKNGICPADTTLSFKLSTIESIAGNLRNDTSVCVGKSIILAISGNSGNILGWESSTDNFLTSTSISNVNDTLTSSVFSDGKYRVLIQNGVCPSDTSNVVTVTTYANPLINITDPNVVCLPGVVDLTDPAVTNGSSPGLTFTYWQDAVASISLGTPNTINTTGVYYIKGTDALGCSTIQNVNATLEAIPSLIVTDPSPVCNPYTIDLTAATITAGSDAGLLYSYWTDVAASNALANPNALASGGTHYIKGTTPNGCYDIQPVTSTVNIAPSFTLSPDLKLLKGNNASTVFISGQTDPIVEWQISTDNFSSISQVISNTSSSQSINNLVDSSWYRVVLSTSTCGNYPTPSIAISVFNPMQFFFPDTITVFKNTRFNSPQSLLNKISFKDPYTTFAQEDTLLSYLAGTFSINQAGMFSFQPANGYLGLDSVYYSICTSDLSMPYCETQVVYFKVIEPPVTPGPLVVYTSFSPNNDGANDSWVIENIEFFPNNTVRILDRWGGIVFEETGYNNTSKVWKGDGKKGNLPDDTYYFVLEIDDKIEKSGFVVLKR